MGLLLLRSAVGAELIRQSFVYLMKTDSPQSPTFVLGSMAGLSGACLLLGFLTPLSGLVAVLWSIGAGLSWFPGTEPGMLFVAAVALAVVFLGPGGFSIDCRLFGRRQIVIPHGADHRNN